MIALLTPSKAQETLGRNLQQRRLAIGWTQAGLAKRAGVALGTLRKFERTGTGSVELLVKLLTVLGGLERIIQATAPDEVEFTSIDEVLEADSKPSRKHGWRS